MDKNFGQDNLNQIIEYYSNQKNSTSQDNIVELLREIQELFGCIPLDVMQQITDTIPINVNFLRQLIKLYPSFTSSPPRHKIVVCVGANCKNKDTENILERIRSFIQEKPFVLTVKNCLKQCRTSPNMQVDHDLYTNINPKDIPVILDNYINKK